MNIIGLEINRSNIITAIVIIALGMLILNQFIGYYYKAQLLKEPCSVCLEFNPHLSRCFEGRDDYGYLPKTELNWSNIYIAPDT